MSPSRTSGSSPVPPVDAAPVVTALVSAVVSAFSVSSSCAVFGTMLSSRTVAAPPVTRPTAAAAVPGGRGGSGQRRLRGRRAGGRAALPLRAPSPAELTASLAAPSLAAPSLVAPPAAGFAPGRGALFGNPLVLDGLRATTGLAPGFGLVMSTAGSWRAGFCPGRGAR